MECLDDSSSPFQGLPVSRGDLIFDTHCMVTCRGVAGCTIITQDKMCK